MHGAKALVSAGVDVAACVPVLATLIHSSSLDVRGRAIALLGHASIPAAQADPLLKAAIRSVDGAAALSAWLGRSSTDAAARRAMLATLEGDLASDLVFEETERPARSIDQEILLTGLLYPSITDGILGKLGSDVLLADPVRLSRLLREVEPGSNVQLYLLDVLADRPIKGVETELLRLMSSPSSAVQSRSFGLLEKLAPHLLLDERERFLRSSRFGSSFNTVCTNYLRPSDLEWYLASKRNWDVLSTKSDKSSLDIVLRHAAVRMGPADVRYGQEAEIVRAVQSALRRWFGPEHVTRAMKRLLEVDEEVCDTIISLSLQHARESDAPAILAVLDTVMSREVEISSGSDWDTADSKDVVRKLMPVLTKIGAAGEARLNALVDSPEVRHFAMVLAQRSPGFDLKSLYLRVLGETKPVHRTWKVVGRQTSTSTIKQVLEDPMTLSDPELRGQALRCLQAWPPDALTDFDFLSAVPHAEALPVARSIVLNFGTPAEVDERLATAALGVLSKESDDSLIDVAKQGLRASNENVRAAAIARLARTQSLKVVPLLIACLDDRSDAVRARADKELSRLAIVLERKKQFMDRFDKLQSGK